MTEEKDMLEEKLPESEKCFTKEQLENIVEQRLSRERRNTEALTEIRQVMALLRKKDAFKNLSNARLAEKLSELAERQTEPTEVLPAEMPPEAHGKEQTFVEKTQDVTYHGNDDADPAERRKRELSEFLSRYGEGKLLGIMNDSAFHAFCVGKSGDISTLYESFCSFLEALASSPEAKRHRAAQTRLASTGFSGGASASVDYGSLLTENQRRIANAAGMSYRQYSELISQIPSKKL